MFSVSSFAFPLAETRLSDLTLEYREEVEAAGTPLWVYAMILVVLAAVGAVAYWYWKKSQEIDHSPTGLLNDLVRAHSIGASVAKLFNKAASGALLDQPALMFASPSCFDETIEKAADRSALSKKEMASLKAVRNKIFA